MGRVVVTPILDAMRASDGSLLHLMVVYIFCVCCGSRNPTYISNAVYTLQEHTLRVCTHALLRIEIADRVCCPEETHDANNLETPLFIHHVCGWLRSVLQTRDQQDASSDLC